MAKLELSSKQLYLRLLRYVLPYWRMFAISIAAMIVVAASEPAFPALLKPMLDGSFIKKDPTTMQMVPLLLVALFVGRGVANFVSSYCISWVANRLVMDLRAEMFRKLIYLPIPFYDHESSGNLVSKLSYDVSQVTAAATVAVTVLVRDSLTIIGLLAWLLYLNWKLTLIALVITPMIALITRLISRRLRSLNREAQRGMGDITHVLEETINCQKVIKVFGGQDYETTRFYDAINKMRRYNMKLAVAAGLNVPVVQIFAAIALATIVYLATLQSAANETTVGGFVSFITAMLMLLAPIKSLTGVNEALQRGLAAAESIFGLIDEKPEPDPGTREIGHAKGALEFRNVSFRYEKAAGNILENFTLSILPGETVALVGQSGSGKTTLANLIPQFYTLTSGQILLDGIDTQELKLASLRANIAMVSQDIILFNDTVAANIAYGEQSNAAETEIVAAAEAAHAMEFIREMPQGLQTFIGENGVRLSGGQRQRLAIARALLKNAPILILDEATSALDTESERHVQSALETLMRGRTTLVIAHRLSTIEKANKIVVMQKGRIVETGTHQELLAHDGAYAKLYRIQFALGGEASIL